MNNIWLNINNLENEFQTKIVMRLISNLQIIKEPPEKNMNLKPAKNLSFELQLGQAKSLLQNRGLINSELFFQLLRDYKQFIDNKNGYYPRAENILTIDKPTSIKPPKLKLIRNFEPTRSLEKIELLNAVHEQQINTINTLFNSLNQRETIKIKVGLEKDDLIAQQLAILLESKKNISSVNVRLKIGTNFLKFHKNETISESEKTKIFEYREIYQKKYGLSSLVLEHIYKTTIENNKKFIVELDLLATTIHQVDRIIKYRLIELEFPENINELKQKLDIKIKLFSIVETSLQFSSENYTKERDYSLENEFEVFSLALAYDKKLGDINKLIQEKSNRIKILENPPFLEPGFQLETARLNEQLRFTTTALQKLELYQSELLKAKLNLSNATLLALSSKQFAVKLAENLSKSSLNELNEIITKIRLNPTYCNNIDLSNDELKIVELSKEWNDFIANFYNKTILENIKIEEKMVNKSTLIKGSLGRKMGSVNYYFLITKDKFLERLNFLQLKPRLPDCINISLLTKRVNVLKSPNRYHDYCYYELDGDELKVLTNEIKQAELKAYYNEIGVKNRQLNELISAEKLISTLNNEIKQLDKGDARRVFLTNLLQQFEILKAKFLSSELNPEQFKINCLTIIQTNITESNLKKLTNEAPDASMLGNFGRFLLDFIHLIADLFEEKQPYRTQFFASEIEIKIAKAAKIAHQDLWELNNLVENTLLTRSPLTYSA
ncbi:MAG: hypothetical protein H0U70_07870 [Tatlockia sp.]|nr:hypothetical protein [Tatlockia sp.]